MSSATGKRGEKREKNGLDCARKKGTVGNLEEDARKISRAMRRVKAKTKRGKMPYNDLLYGHKKKKKGNQQHRNERNATGKNKKEEVFLPWGNKEEGRKRFRRAPGKRKSVRENSYVERGGKEMSVVMVSEK